MKKHYRDYVLILIDMVIICLASVVASTVIKLITYKYSLYELYGYTMLIALIFETAMLIIFKIYNIIVKYSDVSYNIRIAIALIVACVINFIIMGIVYDYRLSAAYNFIQGIGTFSGLLIIRMAYQYFSTQAEQRKQRAIKRIPVMIIGGGWTGNRVISELLRDNKRFLPVCILDDDAEIIGKTMEGVKVVGNTSCIEHYANKYRVKKIIFAIPTAPSDVRKRIINDCMKTGIEVSVLPNLANLIGNADILSTLRKVHIEDLLEREPIKFDQESVRNFVTDKVCMVTGGGGSIGSELCRQIANYKPKELIIADIYENSSFDISNEIKSKYPDLVLYTEIVSITDYKGMEEIFKNHHIDLIFHAAAHKHVPLMEHNPDESVKNNVVGTKNVAQLALIYKTEKFIMVSTDKAVNPTSVMGATKRFCEKIVNFYNAKSDGVTSYAVVRFGNVLGSNGSVIHTFNNQIAEGGPLTVTHKDMIRYFMTIPEAVSLILQAGVYAKGGEVFVLDMGSPVKIVNLAENLIKLAGYKPYRDIDIVFTGLRPGEKLYEELLMDEEGLQKTSNEKIYIGNQSFVCDENVDKMYDLLIKSANTNDGETVILALIQAVETFYPDTRFHKVDGLVDDTILENEAGSDKKKTLKDKSCILKPQKKDKNIKQKSLDNNCKKAVIEENIKSVEQEKNDDSKQNK